MDTLFPPDEQALPDAPETPDEPEAPGALETPGEDERAAIRRTLLRRLRQDGFGGWLLVFFGFLAFDIGLWGQSIPLLVESIRYRQPLILVLSVYALTRIWLFCAAARLLRRAPDAARSVRFALAGRMGFAVLLLFVSFLMLGSQSRSARNLMSLAVLSMACDMAWWFYFRLSRRVRTVLEARTRPQPSVEPEAACPPYGAPGKEENAPGAAAYPLIVWLVLGAALLVVLWQVSRSADGLQELAGMLLHSSPGALLSIGNAWVAAASFCMLSLSPLAAVAGLCLIFALICRVPGGRGLALRLGKLRMLFWALSAVLSSIIFAAWRSPEFQPDAAWWFFLLVPTLVFEIALYAYVRNAGALHAAFPLQPGAKALAGHCAQSVSGLDAAMRLAAATRRAEETAFTGLQGWLLFFAGYCAYSAVFFAFQMPALAPAPILLELAGLFFAPDNAGAAIRPVNIAAGSLALLHAAACLLVLFQTRAAAPFARGLQLLLIACCLILCAAAASIVAGHWMSAAAPFFQNLFGIFPVLAPPLGWFLYFSASRRVHFTLSRAPSPAPEETYDNPQF